MSASAAAVSESVTESYGSISEPAKARLYSDATPWMARTPAATEGARTPYEPVARFTRASTTAGVAFKMPPARFREALPSTSPTGDWEACGLIPRVICVR